MPNDLERRLKQLFAQLQGPSSEVEERALAAALAALPEHAPVRPRPFKTLLFVAAATVVLLALAAGALAAVGALHVSLSSRQR